MWRLIGLVLHILLLGSVFVIYFRSPIITGLHPQNVTFNKEVPAKRLVLIVTDGLRADSFFRNECADIPHIRKLLIQQGIVSLSRTHVPTESRPGHIALIAGLYEDPSAVMRGWKENPIDFDTVFNRSTKTYAWGAKDVLSIFSKVTADNRMISKTYDHDLDFSGKDKTYELDTWVFSRIKTFLNLHADDLQNENGVIFFLHLLGLDTAGHVHKPNSKEFLENLHITEQGIYKVYHHFESIFTDQRTVYVLTSDHGMTNSGSHGSGSYHETDTPLFAWGAGIKNWPAMEISEIEHLEYLNIDGISIPKFEIEQAQITPLISSLLGIPPPVNNFGTMPRAFLNVSQEYMADVVYINALQLIAQYESLLRDFKNGFLSSFLPRYEQLEIDTIQEFQKQMQTRIQTNLSANVIIESSYEKMKIALRGIEYYHTYYKNILLFATSLTFLGWMAYLLKLLTSPDLQLSNQYFTYSKWTYVLLCMALIIGILTILQRVPLVISFYIILPTFVWMLPLQGSPNNQKWISQVFNLKLQNLLEFVLLLAGTELVVASLFHRQLISVAFVLFSLVDGFKTMMVDKGLKFYLWLILVISLTAIPLIPDLVVGRKNDMLLFIGAVITLGRGFLIKKAISPILKMVFTIAIGNGALCIYNHNNQQGLSVLSQTISWAFLLFSLAVPLFTTLTPKLRVESIFFSLTSLYLLLCTSFEPICIVFLCSQLILICSTRRQNKFIVTSPNLSRYNFIDSFRTAFLILLYTFFSFFGTGNMASISSFDPNIIRCFLSTFSPFVIMGLVIFKLTIPIILIISIIFGLSSPILGHKLSERRIYICLLFICDVMGLNFLFLVRNEGSWLEIGMSISHFVIMEMTTVILVLLTYTAKLLLRFEIRRLPRDFNRLPTANIDKFN